MYIQWIIMKKWKNLICVEEDNNHNNGNKDISIWLRISNGFYTLLLFDEVAFPVEDSIFEGYDGTILVVNHLRWNLQL